jgi:hypothetical protein
MGSICVQPESPTEQLLLSSVFPSWLAEDEATSSREQTDKTAAIRVQVPIPNRAADAVLVVVPNCEWNPTP